MRDLTKQRRVGRGPLVLGLVMGMAGVAGADHRKIADPATPPPDVTAPKDWIEHRVPHASASAAYRWVNVVLEASARDIEARKLARPPIIAREMAIAITALYDAWAAYDAKAVGTRLGGRLRRPAAERTDANKSKAIAYATTRALQFVYPADKAWIAEQLKKEGYDPADETTDPAKPQGVGNAAAQAVIEYHKHDGANQLGDEPGSNGQPYSDYTFYEPRNPIDKMIDPDRWQQIPFDDGKGGKTYPGFLAPHWYRVKPFALERADQFRPPPFPTTKANLEQLKKETAEVLDYNGHLTLEQKSIVEFMRDGPRSTGQSGHWLQFAQDVSRRDHYSLDQDAKLFFAVANTAHDAFVASWEAKRFYDSARPWGLVRHFYAGKKVMGYRGPGKGFGMIPAEKWHPYSPATFPTPPFPGYPSGHSTVSGACSKLLELITGSDKYGAVYHHKAGAWTEAAFPAPQIQAVEGKPATALTNTDVTMAFPRFSDCADLAGISRVMGGYHIQADNIEGLKLGRSVATYSWPKYQQYFEGTAKIAP